MALCRWWRGRPSRMPIVCLMSLLITRSSARRKPPATPYDATRCDIYYQSGFSPDFYAWIFPHGDTASVGTGSANKGFSLRGAVGALRRSTGLDDMETVRRE